MTPPRAPQPGSIDDAASGVPDEPGRRLIGRAGLVGDVVARLQMARLVTLVGYGGIGKTRVALAAAQAWARLSGTEIQFVDLSRIAEPGRIWTTVLSTLGVTPLGDARETALRLLGERFALVVFDNCEHLAAAIAQASGDILEHCPGVRILATSREALRTAGEDVVQVAPLGLPPAITPDVTDGAVAEALPGFPAVELLFERMGVRDARRELAVDAILAAGELCLRLDGIPLAIELAAARIGEGAIRDVADQLAARIDVLADASCGGCSIHAGLQTVVDWSYGLLTSAEQRALRAACVFASDFGPQELAAVLPPDTRPAMIGAAINGLVAKSMLQPVGGGRVRLLETTRAYGLARLHAEGEAQRAFDGLAAHVLAALRGAPLSDRTAALGLWHDLRNDAATALHWTLRGGGDRACGIDIVAAALPIWMRVSEISRYAEELGDAIRAIRAVAPHRRAEELQFEFSRSVALYFALGPSLEGIEAGRKACAIAIATGSLDKQLDTSWNLHAQTSHWGAYDDALLYARRYLAAARTADDPVLVNQGWRLIARAYDDLGLHARSGRVFREIVEPGARETAKPITAWGADEKIIRICMDMRVHWFAGNRAGALEAAERVVRVGGEEGQDHCFCWTLAQHVIPMVLWAGLPDAATRHLEPLRRIARHNYGNWSNWADMLEETIDVIGGARPSERLLARIATSWPYRQDMFATLHPQLAGEASLARLADRAGWNWSTPYVLQVAGRRAAVAGDLAQGRALFESARDLAARRGNAPVAASAGAWLAEHG